MNTPIFKLLRSPFFIAVLIVKMFIAVSPALSIVTHQDDIQMEKEVKNDKDESEKEPFKLKNTLDKEFLCVFHQTPLTSFDDTEHKTLFLHPIYCPDHLAAVPTPPPDTRLS